tara:strand:- start:989 stop:1186 length:198 start_codon:yes stop_codon:yes gene_type:complete
MGFQNKSSFIIAVCLLSAATLSLLVRPNKSVNKSPQSGPDEEQKILVGKHSEAGAEADDTKTATQ